MLAVVKEPHIEMCLNGNDNDINKLIDVLRRSYDISVIISISDNRPSQKEDDDEEYVDIRDTDWWRKMATPGNLLAGSRLKHNLTQKQLAKLCGMSHATISAYECGKRPLSMRAAIRLAKAMGEEPESFFANVPKA